MVATVNASTTAGVVITPDNSGALALQSSSATALYVDSSQNVGIGTTSPSTKLQVNATSGYNGISVNNSSSTTATRIVLNNDTSQYLQLDVGSSGRSSYGASGPNVVSVTSGATGGFNLGTDNAYPLALYTNNTERMRIDSSGNVGIGTSSPSTYANSYAPVLVTGTGSNFATIQARSDGPSGYGNGVSYGGSYSTNPINGARMWIGAGGGSGQRGGILFYTKDTDDNTTQPSERMRIDSNGNVGIGTQPSYRLDVVSGANRVAQFVNGTNTSGYSSIFSSIQSNGNNTSTYHFQGNTSGVGNWYLWGNGTTTFSSDQRLKKNIETTRDGYLEDLARLRVVKYNWKNDADGTPKELGLIAQDVEEVFAGLVQDDIGQISDEDTTIYKQLKVSVLPFMLLKAIQELKAINDTQAETINALTARIVALENR